MHVDTYYLTDNQVLDNSNQCIKKQQIGKKTSISSHAFVIQSTLSRWGARILLVRVTTQMALMSRNQLHDGADAGRWDCDDAGREDTCNRSSFCRSSLANEVSPCFVRSGGGVSGSFSATVVDAAAAAAGANVASAVAGATVDAVVAGAGVVSLAANGAVPALASAVDAAERSDD